ncbi:hypothetical protein C8J57DRAFT_1575567 [Mycena rebaudengoi]|jgi:hypothetical protein|nr:hypothetical protein C8J57DRAFT_1575567 [Mycena rebaudengoi]
MHPIPPAAPACAPAIPAQRKRAPPRCFAGPAQWTVHPLTHARCIPPPCPTRIFCAIPATLFRTSHPPAVIVRHRPARHPVIFCCKPFVFAPGPHHAGMTVCACLLAPSCGAHHRRSTTQPSPPFLLLAVHLSLSYSDPGSFSFSFESPFSNFWPSPRSPGITLGSVSKRAYSFGVILQPLIIDSRPYSHHFISFHSPPRSALFACFLVTAGVRPFFCTPGWARLRTRNTLRRWPQARSTSKFWTSTVRRSVNRAPRRSRRLSHPFYGRSSSLRF